MGDIRSKNEGLGRALTPQVYQQVMSGEPRFSGAQAALEYFDVPRTPRPGRGRMATADRIDGDRFLCERLRLAQLQLRGGADLAGRHRESSLGRGARWPRRDGRRPGDDGRHVRHREGRPDVRVGRLLGEGMEFEEHGSSSATSRWRGRRRSTRSVGHCPQTERGLLGPGELPLLRYLYEVVLLERPVDIPWESFFGAASAPRVPRRADRCDARSGGRSPLARSVT